MNATNKVWLIVIGLSVLAVGLVPLAASIVDKRHEANLLARFDSPDPEVRKQAAWESIEFVRLETMLRLVDGASNDPDEQVREACVYALGRLGQMLDDLLESETSGLVLASAWLGIARSIKQHPAPRYSPADLFENEFVNEYVAPNPDDWDRLGIAQARLLLGDPRDVDTLLRLAREGEHAQKAVAARSLTRDLLPLLDAVGQCPVGLPTWDGDTWRPEAVDEIARRCAALPLERIANDAAQHAEAAGRFRRDLGRITSGRDRIAGWLFD